MTNVMIKTNYILQLLLLIAVEVVSTVVMVLLPVVRGCRGSIAEVVVAAAYSRSGTSSSGTNIIPGTAVYSSIESVLPLCTVNTSKMVPGVV